MRRRLGVVVRIVGCFFLNHDSLVIYFVVLILQSSLYCVLDPAF